MGSNNVHACVLNAAFVMVIWIGQFGKDCREFRILELLEVINVVWIICTCFSFLFP